MELKTLVFEKAGPYNINVTLQITRERALALGIKQVISVSICHGYDSRCWIMAAEAEAELIKLGHPLIGPPYGDGKRDKLHGQKEEAKTAEASC